MNTIRSMTLDWDGPQHILYSQTARGGNATTTATWRIGLDGSVEFVGRSETNP